jgi:Protein of unknown function (DUF3489)
MAKSKSSTKTAVPRNTPVARGRAGAKAAAKAVPEPSHAPAGGPDRTRGQTKQALIIGLLQSEGGATLADLVAATGWLAHTTRAALTRLRQAGHILEKAKRDTGATVYHIAAPTRPNRSRKAA